MTRRLLAPALLLAATAACATAPAPTSLTDAGKRLGSPDGARLAVARPELFESAREAHVLALDAYDDGDAAAADLHAATSIARLEAGLDLVAIEEADARTEQLTVERTRVARKLRDLEGRAKAQREMLALSSQVASLQSKIAAADAASRNAAAKAKAALLDARQAQANAVRVGAATRAPKEYGQGKLLVTAALEALKLDLYAQSSAASARARAAFDDASKATAATATAEAAERAARAAARGQTLDAREKAKLALDNAVNASVRLAGLGGADGTAGKQGTELIRAAERAYAQDDFPRTTAFSGRAVEILTAAAVAMEAGTSTAALDLASLGETQTTTAVASVPVVELSTPAPATSVAREPTFDPDRAEVALVVKQRIRALKLELAEGIASGRDIRCGALWRSFAAIVDLASETRRDGDAVSALELAYRAEAQSRRCEGGAGGTSTAVRAQSPELVRAKAELQRIEAIHAEALNTLGQAPLRRATQLIERANQAFEKDDADATLRITALAERAITEARDAVAEANQAAQDKARAATAAALTRARTNLAGAKASLAAARSIDAADPAVIEAGALIGPADEWLKAGLTEDVEIAAASVQKLVAPVVNRPTVRKATVEKALLRAGAALAAAQAADPTDPRLIEPATLLAKARQFAKQNGNADAVELADEARGQLNKIRARPRTARQREATKTSSVTVASILNPATPAIRAMLAEAEAALASAEAGPLQEAAREMMISARAAGEVGDEPRVRRLTAQVIRLSTPPAEAAQPVAVAPPVPPVPPAVPVTTVPAALPATSTAAAQSKAITASATTLAAPGATATDAAASLTRTPTVAAALTPAQIAAAKAEAKAKAAEAKAQAAEAKRIADADAKAAAKAKAAADAKRSAEIAAAAKQADAAKRAEDAKAKEAQKAAAVAAKAKAAEAAKAEAAKLAAEAAAATRLAEAARAKEAEEAKKAAEAAQAARAEAAKKAAEAAKAVRTATTAKAAAAAKAANVKASQEAKAAKKAAVAAKRAAANKAAAAAKAAKEKAAADAKEAKAKADAVAAKKAVAAAEAKNAAAAANKARASANVAAKKAALASAAATPSSAAATSAAVGGATGAPPQSTSDPETYAAIIEARIRGEQARSDPSRASHPAVARGDAFLRRAQVAWQRKDQIAARRYAEAAAGEYTSARSSTPAIPRGANAPDDVTWRPAYERVTEALIARDRAKRVGEVVDHPRLELGEQFLTRARRAWSEKNYIGAEKLAAAAIEELNAVVDGGERNAKKEADKKVAAARAKQAALEAELADTRKKAAAGATEGAEAAQAREAELAKQLAESRAQTAAAEDTAKKAELEANAARAAAAAAREAADAPLRLARINALKSELSRFEGTAAVVASGAIAQVDDRLAAKDIAGAEAAAERGLADARAIKPALVLPKGARYVTVTGTQINLKPQPSFQSGTAVLYRRSLAAIAELATLIKKNKGVLGQVTLTGYTDDRGRRASNVALSQSRADAVRDALIARGAPAALLETAGAGPDNPIADNSTPEGRRANRRVEVRFSLRAGGS